MTTTPKSMKNTATLAALINRTGTLQVTANITLDIVILDAKRCFGRTDVLITPVRGGRGKDWARLSSVSLDEV